MKTVFRPQFWLDLAAGVALLNPTCEILGTTNQFCQWAKLSLSLPPYRLQSIIEESAHRRLRKKPVISRPPKPHGGDDQSEHTLKDSSVDESISGQSLRGWQPLPNGNSEEPHLFYRCSDDTVEVLRIKHGMMDLPRLFSENKPAE